MSSQTEKYIALAQAGWRFLRDNKYTSLFFLALFMIIFPVVCSKAISGPGYVNKDLGYAITGPRGWEMVPLKDKRGVTFHKTKTQNLEKAQIRLNVTYGNPYGISALDYIENGLLKQIRYTYEENGQFSVSFRDASSEIYRKGVRWARVSFFIDYDELQILYVTQADDDRVFILSMTSTGTHQTEDEKAFYKTLDSLVIRKVERKNIFLE